MRKRLIRNFKLARRESLKSDLKTAKIGACGIGKTDFLGFNTLKTHTRLIEIYGNHLSTHAEASVIFRAKNQKLKELYVYREDANGEIKKSRPCRECLALIILHGVRKIYYSISEDEYGMIKNNGVLEETIFRWSQSDKDAIQGKQYI